MRTIFCTILGCLLLAAQAQASALWSFEYTDILDRTAVGTIELFESTADLDVTFDGEDGVTTFMGSFERFEEVAGEASQIVLLQDFGGLMGGQVSLIGDNIMSAEIEVGTQPQIVEMSIIVWDAFSQFQSAGNVTSITRESVSVPEPGTLVALALGFLGILIPVAWGSTR